jgi:hypothetical protein
MVTNPQAFTKVVDGSNLKTLVESGYTSSLDDIIEFILWWLGCMITMGIVEDKVHMVI